MNKYFDPHDFNFPPEIEEGNIEYKSKLSPQMPEERLQQLVSQLKWRITETNECLYYIGLKDDGTVQGLNRKDTILSLQVFKRIVKIADCKIEKVEEFKLKNSLFFLKITCKSKMKESIEISNAFVFGLSGVGKSSLCSLISHSELDDGTGISRLSVLQHRHELLSGITSSLVHETVFLDEDCIVLNSHHPKSIDRDIWADYEKMEYAMSGICLIDSPGIDTHPNTTLFGLSNIPLDFCLFVIDGNDKDQYDQAIDWLKFLLLFNVPVIIVLNKFDVAPEANVEILLTEINNMLKGKGKELLILDSAKLKIESHQIPIVLFSCTSFNSRNMLIPFLARFNKRESTNSDFQFNVTKVHIVKDVGPIAMGYVVSGKVDFTRSYWITPTSELITECKFLSIHRHQTSVTSVKSGDRVAIALDCNLQISKGMQIVSDPSKIRSLSRFQITGRLVGGFSVHSGKIFMGGLRRNCMIISCKEVADGYLVEFELESAVQLYPNFTVIFISDKLKAVGKYCE